MKFLKSPRMKRRALKAMAFCLFAFFVLNPNLKRLVLQAHHIFAPESLIEIKFPGMADINRQIDELMAQVPGRSEIKVIERFVLRRIRYVSDYETWGNMDYWPMAEEVWQKRQEDCDGRAILAVSILRARGYRSARLAVSLDHMWAEVNANEKKPGAPEEITAILHPNRHFREPIESKPSPRHFARLAKAFFHPTSFRNTSVNFIEDIPFPRKAILLTTLLLLCYRPRQGRRALALLLALDCLALSFLAVSDWSEHDSVRTILGVAIGLLALAWCVVTRFQKFQGAASSDHSLPASESSTV